MNSKILRNFSKMLIPVKESIVKSKKIVPEKDIKKQS
jgi:hypothetical protein